MSDPLRPLDCSLPGSSVHGIFQAIVLEWIAIYFSRGSSWCYCFKIIHSQLSGFWDPPVTWKQSHICCSEKLALSKGSSRVAWDSGHLEETLWDNSWSFAQGGIWGPHRGFPSGSAGKRILQQCRRHGKHRLNPWVGKISWRRKWQPTPVFLPGESHEQRSLTG